MLDKARVMMLKNSLARKFLKDSAAFYSGSYTLEDENARFKLAIEQASPRIKKIAEEVKRFNFLNNAIGIEKYLFVSDVVAVVLLLDLDWHNWGKTEFIGFSKIIGDTIFDEKYCPWVVCAQSRRRLEKSLWRVSKIFTKEIKGLKPVCGLESKFLQFLQQIEREGEPDCNNHIYRLRRNLFAR